MSQDQISSELRFDLTGNGSQQLLTLARRLKSVDTAATTLTQTLPSTTQKINVNTAAVRRATTAYRNYTTWVRKAAQAQRTLGNYNPPGTSAASGISGAASSTTSSAAAAAEIEAASAARSIAIANATAAKKQAVLSAATKKGVATTLAAEAETVAILKTHDKVKEAEIRASTSRQLAVQKARIERQLAVEIATQNELIAIAKAEATERIGLATNPGIVAQAKLAAARELSITQAAAEKKIAIQKASDAQRTAIASASSAKRIALAKAEATVTPEAEIRNLSNTRYALYDVSRTAGIATLALSAMFLLPQIQAARYTKAFNSVIRTTGAAGDEVEQLKEQFVNLSTTMPDNFSELSQIGTIAGQLDIASDAAAGFTKNVAQFTATTDVGTEEAATNIGRLAQLTHTAATEYTNLTSAIYQVGVTSVATEGEILDMGSQIATAGDLAGFTNTQIIALAGALSSLGVQPEAARGSLQRIFNIITTGADSSTAKTQQLAKIAGITTEQFQKLWDNGAEGSQEFFSRFVQGLGDLQNSGENAAQILSNLGINAVRDQRLLEVLANNTEVYNRALSESSAAYADGTALSSAYAKQTDNLLDNLSRLGNTFGALLSDMGDDSTLNGIVKGFTELLKVIRQFIDTPFGKVLTTTTLLLTAFLAAVTGILFVSVRMRAAMYGMITAAQGLDGGIGGLNGNLFSLSRQLLQVSAAFVKGNLSAKEATLILNGTSIAADKTSGSLGRMATFASTSFTRAKAAASGFGASLAGFAKSSGWMIALSVAIGAVTNAAMELSKTAQNRADEILGSDFTSTLASALKEDQKAIANGAEAITSFQIQIADNSDSLADWAKELSNVSGSQVGLNDATKNTNQAIKDQTVYIGENTQKAVLSAIVNNEKLQQTYKDYGSVLKQSGFDMSAWFKNLVTSSDNGVGYVQKKLDELNSQFDSLNYGYAFGKVFNRLDPSGTLNPQDLAKTQQQQQIYDQIQALTALRDISQGVATDMKSATSNNELFGQVAAAVGMTTDELADSLDGVGDSSEQAKDKVANLLASLQNTQSTQDAFENLGESITKNGRVFEGYSEQAQDNLGSLLSLVNQLKTQAGDDTAAFGENVLGTMVMLQEQGTSTGGSLSYLGEILNETLGGTYNLDFNSTDAQYSILGVIDSAIAAQQAIISLQATAIANAQTAAMAGDIAAQQALNAALMQRAAAEGAVATLQQLRARASEYAARAQNAYTQGVKAGTGALNNNTGASKKNASQTQKTARTYQDWADDIKSVLDRADDLRFGVQRAMQDIKDATRNAVKAMLDSMYDVNGAYNRIFNSRITSDSQLSLFYDMQEAAQSAADAVVQAKNDILAAQADLAGVQSSKDSLLYGLKVAIDYGDTLRAESIRAKLTQLDSDQAAAERDLANAKKELQEAQESQNKSLTDNSKQGIKNRQTVYSLVGTYTDYLSRLVDSGASAEELQKAVAQSKKDFLEQGKALGFSADELSAYASLFDKYAASSGKTTDDARKAVDDLSDSWQAYILKLISSGASQKTINDAIAKGKKAVTDLAAQMGLSEKDIKKYADSFDDIKVAIGKIPSNVTVKFSGDTSPISAAIKEWFAKNTKNGNYTGGSATIPVKAAFKDTGNAKDAAYWYNEEKKYAKLIQGTTNMSALTEYSKRWAQAHKKYMKAQFYIGGYTGKGGKKEVAGVVHKGEYVFPQDQVNQTTGLPYLMEAATNRTTNNVSMPSVIMVELSPTDRALLAESGGTVVVTLDSKPITAAVNKANRSSAVRGTG